MDVALPTTESDFSQLWRLDIWDHGPSCGESSLLGHRLPASHCALTQTERREESSLMTPVGHWSYSWGLHPRIHSNSTCLVKAHLLKPSLPGGGGRVSTWILGGQYVQPMRENIPLWERISHYSPTKSLAHLPSFSVSSPAQVCIFRSIRESLNQVLPHIRHFISTVVLTALRRLYHRSFKYARVY